MKKLFSNKKNEKGQGLVEYAIILALIAIVVIGVMTTLGKKVNNTFGRVNTALDAVAGSVPNWTQVCTGHSGVTYYYTDAGNYGTTQISTDIGSYICP
jgi:pilus assembly protein Flp/PilA